LIVSSSRLLRRRALLLATPCAVMAAPRTAPAVLLQRLDPAAPPLATASLRGRPWLLNLWATWCAPCRAEHPLLLELADKMSGNGIGLFGLASLDRADAVSAWLARHGNPYNELLLDREGTAPATWGAHGLPSTLVFDAQVRLRWQHDGPLTPALLQASVWPLLRQLQSRPL